MKIAIKTLIVLLATTICLILILNFFSNSVIQSDFSTIETSQVRATIASTQTAFSNDKEQMDNALQSWAQLNLTYAFIQNQKLLIELVPILQAFSDNGRDYVLFRPIFLHSVLGFFRIVTASEMNSHFLLRRRAEVIGTAVAQHLTVTGRMVISDVLLEQLN